MKMKTGMKMPLGSKHAKLLILMAKDSHEDELDCEAVAENMDSYAEYILNSGESNRLIQLIENHLKLCKDCAEEFRLLLGALKVSERLL